MRWEGRRQSENVEDRRGIGGPVLVGGGLITLLLMVAMMFLGFDPQMVAQIAPELAGPQQQAPAKPINDEMTKMVKVVLADNEDATALAAACSSIIKSPALRENIYTSALADVARLDWSVIATQHLALYRRLGALD
jgi:predicted metalloprotease